MLYVTVMAKYRDAKTGKLSGYLVGDKTGNTMKVAKDVLKQAILNNSCIAVNMTLTSDGRLIGRASKKIITDNLPLVQSRGESETVSTSSTSGLKLIEMYTNGKNVVAAMIDNSEYIENNGIKVASIAGLKKGFTFELGNEALTDMHNKKFDNLVYDQNGKVDQKASGIKRGSFSKIRQKLLKILQDNGGISEMSVSKQSNEYFIITILDYKDILAKYGSELINIYYCLIIDSIFTEGLKVDTVTTDKVIVTNTNHIDDVRKAVKTIKL